MGSKGINKIMGSLRARLQNMIESIEKMGADLEGDILMGEWEVRIEMANTWYGKVLNIKLEGLEHLSDGASTKDARDELDKLVGIFEDRYIEIKGRVKEIISQRQRSAQTTTLPIINLPKFAGEPRKFKAFKNLFLSIMESSGSSEKMRIYYLKGCLREQALASISHLGDSASDYRRAWQILNQRYESNRLIATDLLNELLTFPPLSSDKPEELDRFLSSFAEISTSILDLPIENKIEFLLFHIASRVLDNETRKQFARKFPSVEFPSIISLIEFVREQSRIAIDLANNTATETIRSPSPLRRVQNNELSQQSPKSRAIRQSFAVRYECRWCRQEGHSIYQCRDFKALTPVARRKEILKLGLCLNCFGKGHTAMNCPSREKCHICGRDHHTLLHLKIEGTQGRPNSPNSGRSPPPFKNSPSPTRRYKPRGVPQRYSEMSSARDRVSTVFNREHNSHQQVTPQSPRSDNHKKHYDSSRSQSPDYYRRESLSPGREN